jgi:membrane-associated phospholipid phosphatase
MRILNNRHYVSDVIVGAAVGILTAELAYWATDSIFKDLKLFKSHYSVNADYIINNY